MLWSCFPVVGLLDKERRERKGEGRGGKESERRERRRSENKGDHRSLASVLPKSRNLPVKPLEQLRSEMIQLVDSSIEKSTKRAYDSAVKKWKAFTILYSLPFLPTVESLALFITSLFKKVIGIAGILSGLGYYFKLRMDWDLIRSDEIIRRLMISTKKNNDHQVKRAKALPIEIVLSVAASLPEGRTDRDYDNLLFGVMLLIGFFGVMRLGEIVIPNSPDQNHHRKIIQRSSVKMEFSHFRFRLPYHKADRLYEGSTVSIARDSLPSKCYLLEYFESYLEKRDFRFPNRKELFILANGASPNRRWFIDRLKSCSGNSSGHSLRSGGATYYASINIDRSTIQDLGRWKSEVYRTYIQSNPALLAATQNQAFSKARR